MKLWLTSWTVNEFELQSGHYVYFRTNNLGIGWIVPLLSFTMIPLALDNLLDWDAIKKRNQSEPYK